MSEKNSHSKATILKAIEELKAGKFILVCDDATRENEADLIMAAQFVSADHVNFMINFGKGLICTPLSVEVATRLKLPLMVQEHEGTLETAFTVSVDAIFGTHTGISSRDRATTIKKLSDDDSGPLDFARPGHVFPLIANPGGVLVRPGHTEATIDLLKLSGLKSIGVLCETLNSHGEPLVGDELKKFSTTHNLTLISIVDLVDYLKVAK